MTSLYEAACVPCVQVWGVDTALAEGRNRKKKKKKLLAIGHFSLRSWRFFGFFFSFVFHKVVKRNLTRAKAEPRTKKLENDGSR